MDEYKKYLKQDQTDWLLEQSNPSVRYCALKELLDLDETNPKVIQAQKRIMKSEAVRILLKDQYEDGHWGQPGWCMHPPNTAGRLWLLAYIGADSKHPQIRKGVEYLLDSWLTCVWPKRLENSLRLHKGWPPEWGAPCMHGKSLFAFLKLGYINDDRVGTIIHWIVKYMRFDDGDRILPEELQNSKLCQGKHSCIWGVIPIIVALAEIPQDKRVGRVQKVLNRGIEFMLIHWINRRSHDLSRFLNPKLNQLGIDYQPDFVTVLITLTKLGYNDERMQDTIRYLIKKQTKEGKWRLQKPTDRLMISFGEKGEPSKWVTLRAMIALRKYFSLHVSSNFPNGKRMLYQCT